MLEFARFLLGKAHVLRTMKIQFRSAASIHPTWVTEQQNMLKQCHTASTEASVVSGQETRPNQGVQQSVTALSGPFDRDNNIIRGC
jgi:hypothetical protein